MNVFVFVHILIQPCILGCWSRLINFRWTQLYISLEQPCVTGCWSCDSTSVRNICTYLWCDLGNWNSKLYKNGILSVWHFISRFTHKQNFRVPTHVVFVLFIYVKVNISVKYPLAESKFQWLFIFWLTSLSQTPLIFFYIGHKTLLTLPVFRVSRVEGGNVR